MLKTISFAIIHICVAFSVGYLMTGDVFVGGALALVEPVCNSVVFYFHEKAWELGANSGSHKGVAEMLRA